MAFSGDTSGGRVRPSMNVTPLVDVVLVLLIIFMVITPMLMRQFWLHLPVKDDAPESLAAPADVKPPVVLSLRASGELRINRDVVTEAELPDQLRRVFAARSEHTLFFNAADDVPYARAMNILDRARAGGALTIAVLTEPLRD